MLTAFLVGVLLCEDRLVLPPKRPDGLLDDRGRRSGQLKLAMVHPGGPACRHERNGDCAS